MAVLTVQTIVKAGITPSYVAAAGGGDTFVNDGETFFHVKNGDASSITVTFDAVGKLEGFAIADLAVTVAATSEEMVGPFPRGIFNSGATGVGVSYSAVTSVTVAAIKLPRP
jgi:hypothetical protein